MNRKIPLSHVLSNFCVAKSCTRVTDLIDSDTFTMEAGFADLSHAEKYKTR